jgi:hypothetical protein
MCVFTAALIVFTLGKQNCVQSNMKGKYPGIFGLNIFTLLASQANFQKF